MPRGRRPGTSRTREALLGAARRRFAAAGYAGTTLRAIAADAGVDPALVRHFFGSKAALFRAALTWPFDPAALGRRLSAPGRSGAGERLAHAFLELWDGPETGQPLLAVLRGALTHAESAELLRQFLRGQLYRRLTEALGGAASQTEAELRVELAVAQLLGIAVLRHALRVEPLASAPAADVVARVAPALDHYLAPEAAPARETRPSSGRGRGRPRPEDGARRPRPPPGGRRGRSTRPGNRPAGTRRAC
jgi:AcrR family transcriptional regulator